MGFGVVIKTETHFADAETRIDRNKIYLFKSCSTRLDSEPYDRRVFNFTCKGISMPPFALEDL